MVAVFFPEFPTRQLITPYDTSLHALRHLYRWHQIEKDYFYRLQRPVRSIPPRFLVARKGGLPVPLVVLTVDRTRCDIPSVRPNNQKLNLEKQTLELLRAMGWQTVLSVKQLFQR